MKIFISGPMRGIPYYGFPAFDAARAAFEAAGFDVVTPADRGAMSISCGLPHHDGTWEYDAEYELGDAAHAAEAPHEAKDA